MSERILSNALPSYTYEVTFGVGSLGINLQTTKSKKGAYVDTFFRPNNNTILPAEQSGYIKLGDLLLEVNGQDVSQMGLRAIPRLIEQASRPVTLRLERIVMQVDFLDVVRDPRKLPWYMHFLVDKSAGSEGQEASANPEHAKLLLWLEIEQYREADLCIPDSDLTDQARRILRKFFRPDSNFSLIVHVPSGVRSAMLTALALAEANDMERQVQGQVLSGGESQIQSQCPNSLLLVFQEAQSWAATDLQEGSFSRFTSSRMCARMCGHLRNSPPFVKMTLRDVLRCDKKTIFLQVHLSQLRRHSLLHCYGLLKNRPEDDVEGGTGAIEELLQVAMACVHILGLTPQSSSSSSSVHCHGIEDLPMLARLAALLPVSMQLSTHLTKPVSAAWTPTSSHSTYVDRLQTAVCTSVPLSEALLLLTRDARKMAEVKDCIRSLRTRIMRELCSEIMPQFLASSEFEVLLWELDARRAYLAEQEKAAVSEDRLEETSFSAHLEGMEEGGSGDEVELVRTLQAKGAPGLLTPQRSSLSPATSSPSSAPENPYLVVPDGAIQRLLRHVQLPGSMTMHRAPLDLLEDRVREQKETEGGPVALLLGFDTEGGNIVDTRSRKRRKKSLTVSRDYPEHLKNVEDEDDEESDEDDDDSDEGSDGGYAEDREGALFGTPERKKKVIISAAPPEDVTVKYIHPIGSSLATTRFNKNYLSLIPDSINNFLIPHGQCIYDAPTPSKLFNFAVNLPNNSLVYGCCLLLHREVMVRIAVPRPKIPKPLPLPPPGHLEDSNGTGRGHIPRTPSASTSTGHGTGPGGVAHRTPHDSRQPQHPPPKTPVSSFKSLAAVQISNHSTHIPPRDDSEGTLSSSLVTPRKTGGGVSEWIGQLSLSRANNATATPSALGSAGKNSSPFLDRFKGLTLSTPGVSSIKGSERSPSGEDAWTGSDKPVPMGVKFSDESPGGGKHTRGGSDDISSGSDGGTLNGVSAKKRSNNSTISQVEETFTKTKYLLEQEVGGDRDLYTPPLVPEEKDNDLSTNMTKQNKRPVDNSLLIAPTPYTKTRNPHNTLLYPPHLAGSSDSTGSGGSREEVLVPMYVANGFCLLTSVPCISALRQPLSLLASDEERLKGVLESENRSAHSSFTGYSDLEISEDDITYEYSDDSEGESGFEGQDGRSLSSSSLCCPTPPSVYERNAKTRSMRALNSMETARSLHPLRQVFAETNLGLKLPSVLRHGGARDFNAEMVLRALSPKNIVTVFLAFLLESKIAVVSSRMSALLAMGELMKVLIAPLKWSHVYCPLLPKQFGNDLLQCPTPFFVGVQRHCLEPDSFPDDVIVVDLDQDQCTVTEDLQRALPAGRRLTRAISAVLTPALYFCDDISPPSVDSRGNGEGAHGSEEGSGGDMSVVRSAGDCVVREVLRLCKLFVGDLLVGLQQCCTFGVDHDEAVVLFDEAMFVAFKERRCALVDSEGDDPCVLSLRGTLHSQDNNGETDWNSSKEQEKETEKDEFMPQFLRTQCFSLCVIGTVLQRLGPDSRPPSRPSSPYISIPSPTLLFPPLAPEDVSSTGGVGGCDALSQMPTTPVHMS